jgi:glycosyltransferase involved in cell wall biosynthesis
MATVSVILPTCNKKDELMSSLDTILGQSYRNFELIIMDDGSTDATFESIADRWKDCLDEPLDIARAIKSPRDRRLVAFTIDGIPCRYVYQRNRGFSTACNRGVRLARGKLISVTDPEVRWFPERLGQQVRYFQSKTGVYINVVGHIPMRNGTPLKKPSTPGPGGWLFEEIICDRQLSYNAALIHRKCLDVIGGFDENLPNCENYDLWVRLSANFPIHTFEEPMFYTPHRVSPDGKSGWATHRFRVYALEKAFQSGYLNSDYRRMVAEQIVAKCEKLVDGFKQKDNTERANFYERKRKKFSAEVRKLHASRPKPRDFRIAKGDPASGNGGPAPGSSDAKDLVAK